MRVRSAHRTLEEFHVNLVGGAGEEGTGGGTTSCARAVAEGLLVSVALSGVCAPRSTSRLLARG